MTFSATFCTKQLSISINPHFEQSLVPLGWILSNGIQAPQSVASRVLTIPTDSIMHIKLSVCSELAYDLFLARDWLFFCCRTLPQTSFSPSSGVFCGSIRGEKSWTCDSGSASHEEAVISPWLLALLSWRKTPR
ncbi:hypothetical protein B0H14DRAFT_3143940 [Mycena olivaceomarginata]|nr:hypothetical protein B0H14DRAFT_3143940 [Mycena olivaceomarginata]